MNEIAFKFNDVTERDMDMLFLEEMASSKAFANIFLSKVGIENADIIETELSKTSIEFGESDMTVVFSIGNRKHALLIEDKIDAIAMPQQCERYFKRGELEIASGEYDSFDVFIIAPEKYLSQNIEAAKYPNKVTYEECAEYFASQNNIRSAFKLQQISQAINKQKHGYQVIENKAVTEFWDKYITYKEQNHPELWLVSKRGVKGANSRWPHYNTVMDNMFIYHKSEVGYVDMTISGAADKIILLEQAFKNASFNLSERGMTLVKTGKSAAIRVTVPVLDFTKPFEIYFKDISVCFDAIVKLTNAAKEISKYVNIVKLVNG